MKNTLFLSAILFTLFISYAASAAEYKIETVAEGLSHPWSMAFLPDGSYLVAHRVGELRRVSKTGDVSDPIQGAPDTYFAGQGGFFDITLDPNFGANQIVYLSYAGGTPEANATTVMRARLVGDSLEDQTTIFSLNPTKDTPQHYGGKLQFLNDGTLLLSTGDGFEYREAAQDKQNQMGKIIRMNTDGSAPADNPFADGTNGNPNVYSYGHRNPQGLTLNPKTGAIYMHEHGPKGGDEVNLVKPGQNYGWPAVTYGENYSGAYVSPLTQAPGVTEPIKVWVPSIAPSGMVFYTGSMFPEWQGRLFVGALVDQEVRMLTLEGETVSAETTMFAEIGARVRDVRQGLDGALYILTDGEGGKVLRIIRQ